MIKQLTFGKIGCFYKAKIDIYFYFLFLCSRIHNIYEPEKMMKIISLGQIDNSRGLSPMHPSLYSVFGDSAVSFDFGTPVHVPSKFKSARTKNLAWPIFILQGNGEILILYSDITSK